MAKILNVLLAISILSLDVSIQQGTNQLFYIGPGVFRESRTRTRANLVFLSQDGATSDGVLAGFATYVIKSQQPVELQIWRPVNLSTFQLISTYPYKLIKDDDVPNFQDIHLNDSCVRIAKGDKVGIYFKDTVWPIPYRFIDDSQQKLRSLMLDLENKGNVSIGFQASIDELIFPFQFSIAAWVSKYTSLPPDFNPNIRQTEECPKNIPFPTWLATTNPPTTTTPKTPPMGFTGGTGSQGPRGALGAVGSTGSKGHVGGKGATGDRGDTGAFGDIGTIGLKGEKGMAGFTGSSGAPGPVGSTGSRGSQGLLGPKGKQGKNASYVSNDTSSNIAGDVSPSQVVANQWWRKRNLIIGLYVWAAILSVLVLSAFLWAAIFLGQAMKEKNN